jgi:hypothetical protein
LSFRSVVDAVRCAIEVQANHKTAAAQWFPALQHMEVNMDAGADREKLLRWCAYRGDRLAGTKTKSALNLEVLSRSFAPVRDFLVFHDLPLIENAEAGSFDRRDVDKHISAAATLRLNEPKPDVCR